jgi:hypothetical protein
LSSGGLGVGVACTDDLDMEFAFYGRLEFAFDADRDMAFVFLCIAGTALLLPGPALALLAALPLEEPSPGETMLSLPGLKLPVWLAAPLTFALFELGWLTSDPTQPDAANDSSATAASRPYRFFIRAS